jgi:hypothetical protein
MGALKKRIAGKVDLSKLAEKWPSPFVARKKVDRFSGGTITPKYMANLDSMGKGPQGRIRIGRQVVYPVGELVKWLESRALQL